MEEFDIQKVKQMYKNKDKKETISKIEPINYVDKSKMSEQEKQELKKIGEEIIKNNKYAVVTMAGGQGTRLGCNGPKGTYKLDIGKNGKYIFEILIEKLKKAKEIYGTEINWYLMTSEENNKQTIDFFEEHNYFGYNKEKIKFFTQGVLPLVDLEGNIITDENGNVKTASDGNGSVYVSLKKSGMLDDMKSKNVKWIYVCGVDNIMVNMVDPIFLGLTVKQGMQSASKSIKKSYPEEKVGIYCKKEGKPGIIEYIDMTDEMIHQKDANGELTYGEANIVSHLFNISAIEEISKHELTYHCAIKNNACKFECFIFDGFEYLDNMAIMRVKREEEFAPIKNKTGVDSPETAKEIYERNFKNEI